MTVINQIILHDEDYKVSQNPILVENKRRELVPYTEKFNFSNNKSVISEFLGKAIVNCPNLEKIDLRGTVCGSEVEIYLINSKKEYNTNGWDGGLYE